MTPYPRVDSESLSLGSTSVAWSTVATGYGDSRGWLHSGVTSLDDGSVVMAHPEGGSLIVIAPDGHSRLVPTPLTEMHALTTAVDDDGSTLVWAADNGRRFVQATPRYERIVRPGRAVALSPEGQVRRELQDPGADQPWSPTSIAVVDPRDPASDVWVADGYATSLVHCFDAEGKLVATIDGRETGQTFVCPHGLMIRPSATGPELYVADRTNKRIVVYGLSDGFRRVVGEGPLGSPSSMVLYGNQIIVTELFGALAVFDGDAYVAHIGSSARSHDEDGWPNRLDERGNAVAPVLVDGIFNSPHGVCVADDGSLYVTEWLIGGRLVRLTPTVTAPTTAG